MKMNEIEELGTLVENMSNELKRIKEDSEKKQIQITCLIKKVDTIKKELKKKYDTIKKLNVFLVCFFIVVGSCIFYKIQKESTEYENGTPSNLDSKKTNETLKNLKQYIEESEKRVNSLNDKINILYLRTNVIGGELWLIVDKFSERKISGEVIYSDYFYSHFHGYKLKLAICPKGLLMGKSNHLFVSILIYKGEYDDDLSWPCKHSFKVSVVNQSTGEDHKSMTFSYSTVGDNIKYCFNKPTKNYNDDFGSALFISHEELQTVTVNDFVFIKCRVFAPL